jgi:periplasmic copper chaperone A
MRLGHQAAAIFTLAPFLVATPAQAHEFHRLGDIVIEQPWARATPVKVGGAYMTLRNNGAVTDRLINVASPLAEKAEIHETKIDGGTAMMRAVGDVELRPRRSVQMKPGGLHVMLMGLQRPLKEGERIKLVLTFERAGTIEVEARVEKAGAAAPGDHQH